MFRKLQKWITTKETKDSRDKNYHMARFISLLISIQGMIMFIISLVTQQNNVAWIALSYSVIMFFVFIHTTFSQKLFFFYTITCAIIIFLELDFLINGGTEGFGIIWMLTIPLFTVYLFGPRFFYAINSVILGILILGMWTPLNRYIYQFRESFILRFPLVYILEFLFGGFLKYRIRKTEKDLEVQKNILSTEIHQAALIQKSFFRQHVNEYMDWTVAYQNIPMAGVSGDLYDVYSAGGTLDGVGIFDVSGHGISSGLITMLVKNIIYQEFYKKTSNPLSDTVTRINKRFIMEKADIQNYLTGIVIKINGNQLELVNAGHQYPILYHKSTGTFQQIKKSPEAVGAIGFKNVESVYVSQYIDMESGDELILFTDGIIDAKNKDGEKYGHQRFMESIENHIFDDVNNQVTKILAELHSFQDKAPAEDDVTLMILKKD